MNAPHSIRSEGDSTRPGDETLPSETLSPPGQLSLDEEETGDPLEQPQELFPPLHSSIWGSEPYEFPPAPEEGTVDPRYGPSIAPEEDPFRELVEPHEPTVPTIKEPVTFFGLLEEVVHSSSTFFLGALSLSHLAMWGAAKEFRQLAPQAIKLEQWAGLAALCGTLGFLFWLKKRSPLVRSLVGIWCIVGYSLSGLVAIDHIWGSGAWANTPFAQWWLEVHSASLLR